MVPLGILFLEGVIFLSPVGLIVAVILMAMAASARYRRRMLPRPSGDSLRVQVGSDGQWRYEGRLVSFADPWEVWSVPRRSWVPRGASVEVFGVARDQWVDNGYRDAERRTVIAALPGCAHVDVFVGSRAFVERALAGYAIGWKTWLLFAISLATLVTAGIWVSTMFGFG